MITPVEIPEYLFAPCSMSCMVCYVYLKNKKPCNGCLGNDINKPERCKTCAIKVCVQAKGIKYCYECPDFPCKAISNMERSYRKRYGAGLIENAQYVKENGIVNFQVKELKKLTCYYCNGIVALHDGICSECGKEHENYSKILKNKVKKEKI